MATPAGHSDKEILDSIPASGTDSGLRAMGMDLLEEYLSIIRSARFDHGHAVLELATGPGRAPALLTRLGYIVITGDLSPDKNADLWKRVTDAWRHRVTLCQLDMASLPFRSNAVRSVLCVNTIHELEEPERCVRELTRILHPEGTLAIADFSDRGFDLMDEVHRAAHGKDHDRGKATLRDIEPLLRAACTRVRRTATPLNDCLVCSGKLPV